MFLKLIKFLDDHEWACWLGIVTFGSLVLAIDAAPSFPFNLF